MSEDYKISDSPSFLLPIGIYNASSGTYTRQVTVDEWRGHDQEALTSPIAKQNFAAGITNLLQRLVIKIGENGEVLSKQNPLHKCADGLIKSMHQADREMILIQSLAASGEDMSVRKCVDKCQHCNIEFEFDFDLKELNVTPWDHAQPPWIDFDLKEPLVYGSGTTKRESTKARFFLTTGVEAERLAKKSDKGEFYALFEMIAECTEFLGIGRVSSEFLKMQRRRVLDNIRDNIQNQRIGVESSLTRRCPSCAEDTEARLDLARFLL